MTQWKADCNDQVEGCLCGNDSVLTELSIASLKEETIIVARYSSTYIKCHHTGLGE